MPDKIDELVDEVLETGLKDVSIVDTSLDGRGDGELRKLESLYLARTNKLKVEAEINARNRELDIKEAQVACEREKVESDRKEAKKNRIKDIGLGVLGIAAPLVTFGVWAKKGFEFEKTGTITSSTMRNIWNRLDIFKKLR